MPRDADRLRSMRVSRSLLRHLHATSRVAVGLRVPVASSAASEVIWRSVRQISRLAYCGEYQRTLLLTSGW